METIFHKDKGLAIRLALTEDGVAVNLATATNTTISARKPSGEIVTWDAEVVAVTGGTALQYIVETDDLDEVGVWQLQGHLTIGTWTGSTSVVKCEVGKSFIHIV